MNPATGPGNIKKFLITGKGGKSVDLSGGVVEYRYYENLISNTITSTATIVETGIPTGVLDSLPIRGGEKVDVIVVDPRGYELNLKPQLRVNRVRDAVSESTKQVYHIDFCSEEQLIDKTKRVVNRYQGKISDNVLSILQNVLGTTAPVFVDTTSLNFNFNGNLKRPLYLCTWLASKSVPKKGVGNTAGFLFYQTREGLFFKSIDELFKQPITKKLIYNDTEKIPPTYNDKILSYNIKRDTDVNKNLLAGSYNNTTIYFDFLSMEYKVNTFNIEEQEKGSTTAGSDFNFVDEAFTKSPSRIYYTVGDIGVNPKGSGEKQLKNWKKNPLEPNFNYENTQMQSVMRYNQLFTIQTEIIIAADFSIKAGDIVYCTFPNMEISKNKEKNPQTSYRYMVGSVCHRVTTRDSYTSLGLIRDSFGKRN